MVPQFEERSLQSLIGCYYNHIPEIETGTVLGEEVTKHNIMVVIKVIKHFNFDYRRYWRLATVWFDVREKLKTMKEDFNKWWNIEGFGHCGDEFFHGYSGFTCKLSGMLTQIYHGEQRANEEEKARRLRTLGFDVIDGHWVTDNENNRKLLFEMLQTKFPSCRITDISSHWSNETKRIEFRDIKIYISDLNDFQ